MGHVGRCYALGTGSRSPRHTVPSRGPGTWETHCLLLAVAGRESESSPATITLVYYCVLLCIIVQEGSPLAYARGLRPILFKEVL